MSNDVSQDDPFLWLEEIEGQRALGFVEGLNAASLPKLERQPDFEQDRSAILAQLNAPDRIAYGVFRGDYIYNFWQDEANVRGLIRRTARADYVSGQPQWETVLDIDALAKAENANWVYKGLTCLGPEDRLCMVALSPGGSDAVELREFDLQAKDFVTDGFVVPEAKTWFDWVDENHLLVGTDYGPGSTTQSGYPRTQRLWQRGTALEEAPEVFHVPQEHMGVYVAAKHEQTASRVYLKDAKTFWSGQYLVFDARKGSTTVLALPDDANVVHFGVSQVLALMRSAWTLGDQIFPAGALVGVDVDDPAAAEMLFKPNETQAISAVSVAGEAIYISLLDNVSGSLLRLTQAGEGGWTTSQMRLPKNGTLQVVSTDTTRDELLINFESFGQPETLYFAQDGVVTQVQNMPERFDPDDIKTEQAFATSADGTKVPYYVIKPRTARRGQPVPTWVYAYGGFEISLTPSYLSPHFQRWLASGGAVVIANIRGGGEYGPAWHQAALLNNRHKAYEDMAAVLDDVVDRRLTIPEMVGVAGGSNGGLLTGVMLTRYPDKHNAAIIAVPLLDMLRYDKLLAGASWTGEYGDPDDPDLRSYLASYSPYQNVSNKKQYPEAFIYTSTKDDRVHPGHARKFAAKLAAARHPFLYYENIEGGHAGAANQAQTAYRMALELAFMKMRLFKTRQ
ncbi:MAG: prolyl oligopeptidase family serine peptidase [Pseudomonadota bacterium]